MLRRPHTRDSLLRVSGVNENTIRRIEAAGIRLSLHQSYTINDVELSLLESLIPVDVARAIVRERLSRSFEDATSTQAHTHTRIRGP